MLAFLQEERLRHSCGHPVDESTDPANERAYTPHVNVCFACEAVQRRLKALQSDGQILGAYGYATKD